MSSSKIDRPDKNQSGDRASATMPELAWRRGTCPVCGEGFDYLNRRQPSTCNNGDCRYRYRYKIEPSSWADYQPTLFDAVED